jgi:hypothetical protein
MENTLPPIKVIDKDAIIKLEIGTGMIERIQEILEYFAKQVTQEQIDKYNVEVVDFEKISRKEKEFTEEWMIPVTTLSFLLKEIEKQADLQGFTKETNMEDYVKAKISEAEAMAPSIEEDNQ